jgi:hypothetical protein
VSDTYETVGAIRRACADIRDHWDATKEGVRA